MHGNNTMTKETFARAQSQPRKIELAKILLGKSPTKKQDALDSGFNEMIIQEMARDISKNVEGMQNFAVDLKHGVTAEAAPETQEGDKTQVENEGEQSSETSNENQPPTTSNDPVDQNPTVETEVVDQTQNPTVQTEGTEQSTPNPTNPGTTPQA